VTQKYPLQIVSRETIFMSEGDCIAPLGLAMTV